MSKQPLDDRLDQAITEMFADPLIMPASAAEIDISLGDLVRVARDLRDLPRPSFKSRLRSELERSASMSTIVQYRPGFRTVTPYLVLPNGDFIDFAHRVFGAEETHRTVTSPKSFHAEMQIGDSMLMIGVGAQRSMPTSLLVHVPNAEAVYQRALEAGAVSLEPMIEDHGARFGCVQDPAGNQWCISTHLGKDYVPDNMHAITACFHPAGAAKFIEFLATAFGARELERYDGPQGTVMWSVIRIGDSVVGVSEPGKHLWAQPMPTMIYLYVPDVDALYDRAIRAGAQPIHPPANQSYGDRSGGVTDAWGNHWYMATPQ